MRPDALDWNFATGRGLPTWRAEVLKSPERSMPANLSAEYKAAEAAYRKAHDPRERRDLLREMLRAVPKHKGTDHLEADIKHRPPFTSRQRQTVGDVAKLVYKDVAHTLRYARVWGHSGFDGQQVGREHALADGDIVELHG